MNSANYKMWLENKPIPNMPLASMLVIDSEPPITWYTKNKPTTTSSFKADNTMWLQNN
jgi:hypothetical protein